MNRVSTTRHPATALAAWHKKTASPADNDSSPGNGSCCKTVEDDEAAVTIKPAGSLPLVIPDMTGWDIILEKIYTNPVYFGLVTMVIHNRESRQCQLVFYDQFGKKADEQMVELQGGRNELFFDVTYLESGIYQVEIPGHHLKYMPVRFVVERWRFTQQYPPICVKSFSRIDKSHSLHGQDK